MFRCVVGVGALAFTACLAAGCVDPNQDYTDWLSRTGDARAPAVIEAGIYDGSLPDGGFEETLLMVCLPAQAGGNVADVAMLTATVKFTPSAEGGGTFDFTDQPLLIGATDLTQTVGDVATVNGSPVAADGTCAVHFGPTSLPAAGNPLGAVAFSSSTLYFTISQTSLCAAESAVVTSPIMTTLDPKNNFCIFRPPTSPFPKFQVSDFHCP